MLARNTNANEAVMVKPKGYHLPRYTKRYDRDLSTAANKST